MERVRSERARSAVVPASRSAVIPASRPTGETARAFGNRAVAQLARSVVQTRRLQRFPVQTSLGQVETKDLTTTQLAELIRRLEQSPEDVDRAAIQRLRPLLGTTSGSHLLSEYYTRAMRPGGPLAVGVERRYLTPVEPDRSLPANVPQRSISEEQARSYAQLQRRILAAETHYSDTHVPFYHGADPRWRVAQDVYRGVRERLARRAFRPNFHFMRYPGPGDATYGTHMNVAAFFQADMQRHGVIDDNLAETKAQIISANIALHGGLGHAGEETFHYFQIAKGQTVPDVAGVIRKFLADFGIDAAGEYDPQRLVDDVAPFNDTPEGSLFQILLPREIVDEVAYLAHPHGLPHDDELFDALHGITPIRYNDRPVTTAAGTVDRQTRYRELLAEETARNPRGARKRALERLGGVGVLEREKMNTEVTRNLAEIRAIWGTHPPDPATLVPGYGGLIRSGERVTATEVAAVRAQLQAAAEARRRETVRREILRINHEMRQRFQAGEYRPSRVIDTYIHHPDRLKHPEFDEQIRRVRGNPEHFGEGQGIRSNPEHFVEGQGIRSHHENMRIRNRLNFIQARILINEMHMLNPYSRIVINRFTTMSREAESAYRARVAAYVDSLFRRHPKSRL